MARGALKTAGLPLNEPEAVETTKGVTAHWGLFQDSLLERLDAPGSPDTPLFSSFALALDKPVEYSAAPGLESRTGLQLICRDRQQILDAYFTH